MFFIVSQSNSHDNILSGKFKPSLQRTVIKSTALDGLNAGCYKEDLKNGVQVSIK